MKSTTKLVLINVVISLVISIVVGGSVGLLASNFVWPDFQNFVAKIIQKPVVAPVVSPAEPKIVQGGIQEKPVYITEEEATAKVVKDVSPAVVSVVISKEIAQVRNMTGPNIFPFDDFFNFGFPFAEPQPQQQPQSQPKTQKKVIGGGTGFIISSDGMILTNKHVVADATAEYSVVTLDNKNYPAKILAADPILDVALIKIEAKNLPVVTLGDSGKIQIGQTVIAIGNTLSEYRNTVTKGVISGVNRRVVAGDGQFGTEVIEQAIQIDAAINPGNSGGPLVNLRGEVIGMNTAVSNQGQSIGFAIPINVAKPVIESVKKYGRIVRPWLGVRYVLINKELTDQNQLPVDYGALILHGQKQTELAVVPGGPADKAGLVENDIILELNSQKITEDNTLSSLIQKYKPGDKIKLKVLHKGEDKTVEVILGELK